jgi:hypothetical protein
MRKRAEKLVSECDKLRARFAAIAQTLEESADFTEPSHKSDIQRDTARRIREALADPAIGTPAIVTAGMKTWSEMFPEGRDIFYEGDDPEGFADAMRDQFRFDPSEHPNWEKWIEYSPSGPDGFWSFGFRCPAEHLDEVYGSGRWQLGS